MTRQYLGIGDLFISKEAYLIQTSLGSCVSVCIRDRKKHFGGINHFMLPESGSGENNIKYGNISTNVLIDSMVKEGSRIEDLEAAIIGGSNLTGSPFGIGRRNIGIAEEILSKRGIRVVYQDTGGNLSRSVLFNSETGEIQVKFLKNLERLRHAVL